MTNQPLKFYMHDGASSFRFELAGYLDREGARQLSQSWRTASSVSSARTLVVDMTFVTGVDESGRELLNTWHRDGARIVANSSDSLALAESIIGESLPQQSSRGVASAREWTWSPVPYLARAASAGLLLLALLFPTSARGATLRSETTTAWENYLQTVSAQVEARVQPGGSFLWTAEDPARLAKVLNGEIVVSPAPGPSPRRVPGGLIHHWMGAAFLPNLKIEDVLEVTRDYDHYKQIYRPTVIESKSLATDWQKDIFSMRLMNNALLLRVALDAEYQVNNFWLDGRRAYSISRTTHVQEIEGCGQRDEHRITEGEGSGYIWKLFSIARYAERDGGVYVELEAIALSRDVPSAMHLIADPIVRRVSRNSLHISLRQTRNAVLGRGVTVLSRADAPLNAGQSRHAAFAGSH